MLHSHMRIRGQGDKVPQLRYLVRLSTVLAGLDSLLCQSPDLSWKCVCCKVNAAKIGSATKETLVAFGRLRDDTS